MSMNEFESLLNEWEDGPPPHILSEQALHAPDDFSGDELDFAHEMGELFCLKDEEIPPYFAQTLLEAEEHRFASAEENFEQKTYVHVFQRLQLQRQLFPHSRPTVRSLVTALPMQRSMMALVAACLFVMLFTMFATGTSFAKGWNVLWSGAHSGVIQVSHYPSSGSAPTAHTVQKGRVANATPAPALNLVDAQQLLHFSMYWPNFMPDSYVLSNMYLHQGTGHIWADGPILELDYHNTAPGIPLRGTGHIVICEFKPLGDVFQVVQLGAAHLIQIDNNGQATAIYVDGQWTPINRFSHDWVYGERSELIYERDGVIFWIVGDQRDGVNSNVLRQIAGSLSVFNVNRAARMGGHMQTVLQSPDDNTWIFANDVVYSDNSDGLLTGTSVGIVGKGGEASQPPQLKGSVHSH